MIVYNISRLQTSVILLLYYYIIMYNNEIDILTATSYEYRTCFAYVLRRVRNYLKTDFILNIYLYLVVIFDIWLSINIFHEFLSKPGIIHFNFFYVFK